MTKLSYKNIIYKYLGQDTVNWTQVSLLGQVAQSGQKRQKIE